MSSIISRGQTAPVGLPKEQKGPSILQAIFRSIPYGWGHDAQEKLHILPQFTVCFPNICTKHFCSHATFNFLKNGSSIQEKRAVNILALCHTCFSFTEKVLTRSEPIRYNYSEKIYKTPHMRCYLDTMMVSHRYICKGYGWSVSR